MDKIEKEFLIDNYLLAYELAGDPETEVEILEFLSMHPHNAIKEKVALNRNSTNGILINLSKNKYATVRASVASNVKCPKDILKILNDDENKYVRIASKR